MKEFKNISLIVKWDLDAQVDVLFEILKNVLDEGTIRARIVRYKLQKHEV